VIFNDILGPGMPFYNLTLSKKALNRIISESNRLRGIERTLDLLDDIKDMGFKAATRAGLSFGKSDMKQTADKKRIIDKSQAKVDQINGDFRKGVITEGERYNQIIDCWTHAREAVGQAMMAELQHDTREGRPYLNPIFLMAESGARGSIEQIRQLAGMRGLMAKPSGKIIEQPITSNFREGLNVLEYFSSTHGARKGLADTALKTADSGYLTRKLADVAQNVVVNLEDCGTLNGITKQAIVKGERVEVPLKQVIRGRVSLDTITDRKTGDVVVATSEMITEAAAAQIEAMGIDRIRVRTALTCEADRGICAKCYGMDLSRGRLVELGTAVGIIAAQSIGEPGTQLTMRTFHIGGTAHKVVEASETKARNAGRVAFHRLRTAVNREGVRVALDRNGEIAVVDPTDPDKEFERYTVPLGAVLPVPEGERVQPGAVLCRWDPHNIPILAEKDGQVRFEDIVEGVTMRIEQDPKTKVKRMVLIEHKGDLHPNITIVDPKTEEALAVYYIPEKAHVEVDEGDGVVAGSLLAKTPRGITGTQDITGGLPRVTELFEARKPKEPSVVAEIDGMVEIGERKRGKRTIVVKNEETGMSKEHLVPHGTALRVHKGDRVKAGDALVDGAMVPHDILRIGGEEAVQQYLLREILSVYRSQNVTIDDKHVEIIVTQMMRMVRVENPGDTEFLPGSVVDKAELRRGNAEVQGKGGMPATFTPLLVGITKASLQSTSFISAASFQETTKVLTEAALAGKIDTLQGLKENVIVGHMIPAGTGFPGYGALTVGKNVTDEEIQRRREAIEEERMREQETLLP
jgi:DNA-directed RNA polymerase subunit beta'